MSTSITNNKKKRSRDDSTSSAPAAPSSSSSSSAAASSTSTGNAKTDRNRKKKQLKRSKKRTAANKVLKKQQQQQQQQEKSNDNNEDEDDDDDRRDSVETMLLEGHVVEGRADDNAAVPLPLAKKTRDFSSDLKLYLDQWQTHHNAVLSNNTVVLEYSQWKFNKVLQAWALDHCLEKDRLSLELFKQLLGYIATVRGGARERLRERMIIVIQDKEALSNDAEVAAEVKRAKKVLITLGKSDEV